MPSIEAWLRGAVDDVMGSSRTGVAPVLEALAKAATGLRRGDWNADASRDEPRDSAPAGSRAGRRG